MKIDHPDKLQGLNAPPIKTPDVKETNGADFSKVLNEVSENAPPAKATPSMQSRPVQSAYAGFGIQQIERPGESASRLIDLLEQYQQILSDPGANMRQVGTVVDQMKSSAVRMQPMADGLPEGDVIRSVMQDTLVQINMEIDRFDRGEYVDA